MSLFAFVVFRVEAELQKMFLSLVTQALHLQLIHCVITEEHEQADKRSELKQRSMQSEFQYFLVVSN